MGKDKPSKTQRQPDMSEEDVLREVREDQRLERLGIDPYGDPVDIILQLWALKQEIDKRHRRKVNP